MIWKNPFYIRQAEKVDSESFFQLFSSESLEFINKQSFNTMQFIRSSPGAGKTTIFNALQSDKLGMLSNDNEYEKDYYEMAVTNGLIVKDEVKILSCIISCAKNYDLLDDLFRNGRRQHVFFALINVRLVVLMLKSLIALKGMTTYSELKSITFVDYPEECLPIIDYISNGYDLFRWAQKEEKKICNYLDDMRDEPTNFSLNYRTLFFASLFEPNNILYNSQNFLHYSLIVFDDVQKLTSFQRELLITTLYTMRPRVGVWIGERLEALEPCEIISNDGTIGREYEIINLEDYWKKQNKSNFRKILTSIADRRVRLYSDQVVSFESCLDNRVDHKEYEEIYGTLINEIKTQIQNDFAFGKKYIMVMETIDSKKLDFYERVLSYLVLDILYKRDISKGQLSIFPESMSINDFEKSMKEHKDVAAYYLSVRTRTPFYYGFDNIISISSYNIEQFLSLAGAIFEQFIARKIVASNSKQNLKIKPAEQEKFLRQVANQRFDDILRRFEYGESIQNLLKNLSKQSLKTRDKGTNSYAGGAVTGVAVPKDCLKSLHKPRYAKLAKVISDCISSNIFEKSTISQGGTEWMVLYYNRWVCLYFNLPLKYGGWFRSSLDQLNEYLKPQNYKQMDDISIPLDQLTMEG